MISSRMMAAGNCRFYTQAEHEFIDRIPAARLVALSIRAVEATPNLSTRALAVN